MPWRSGLHWWQELAASKTPRFGLPLDCATPPHVHDDAGLRCKRCLVRKSLPAVRPSHDLPPHNRGGQRAFVATGEADQAGRVFLQVVEGSRPFALDPLPHLEAGDELTKIL